LGLSSVENQMAQVIDPNDVDARIMLTISNLQYLRTTLLPSMLEGLQSAFGREIGKETSTLMEVVTKIDSLLFEDYIQRKGEDIAVIIRKGILEDGLDWLDMDKPTGPSLFYRPFQITNSVMIAVNRGPSLHLRSSLMPSPRPCPGVGRRQTSRTTDSGGSSGRPGF